MAEGWTYVLCHQDFRFELKSGEQTVGRSRTSDVAVNDPSVSRKHVILKPKNGMVMLTDLGSSNGTFVNGKKVQGEAVLEDGDILRLGDAELRVEVVNAESMRTVRLPAGGPRPQPGDATFFLAAESMKLAEALEAKAEAGPPEPGSHVSGPLSTQRLPASALPGAGAAPAGHETLRMPAPPLSPFAPAAAEPAPSPLGTQRIDLGETPLPAPPVAAGAQTVRLSAAEMRQLEAPAEEAAAPAFAASPAVPPSFEPLSSEPPSFEPASFEPASFEPVSFEPVSFEPPPGAGASYPSFEAPPAFEAWTPPPPEDSFAGIADPSSPALDRPAQPWAAPASNRVTPPAYPPAETFVEPEPPASSFSPPSFASASPAPSYPPPAPAFAPPATPPAFAPPAAPPAFAPPAAPPAFAPPAFAPPAAPPAFAPPAAPPASFAPPQAPPPFAPPASFDRPTAPAAPPPPPGAADALRGPRQPSSTNELLPSLDDLDAAIGTPGIQDPLAGRGAAQAPVGVPFGGPCAGFGVRLVAYLLDVMVFGGISTAVAIFSNYDPIFMYSWSILAILVIFFGWSIWGTSPGKRVVGLYLHGEDGQTGIGFLRAFIRMVGYILSFVLFGAGFLMIAFTKDRRGLHDRIARTWVYRHSS